MPDGKFWLAASWRVIRGGRRSPSARWRPRGPQGGRCGWVRVGRHGPSWGFHALPPGSGNVSRKPFLSECQGGNADEHRAVSWAKAPMRLGGFRARRSAVVGARRRALPFCIASGSRSEAQSLIYPIVPRSAATANCRQARGGVFFNGARFTHRLAVVHRASFSRRQVDCKLKGASNL